ncbi:uncharacterized protein SRS1_13662 [Sporisorium reilianum f. sp. reilianum]|uniref:Uncharacterized protein n=1 Tax=Sporisorium reilianum f. sp. reilianum TaxID=72559 RepID=A0A2N8UEP0_9BASI|nr:uncharacterized protein SRS1_13662 [Sporisorium reilianum f. sp. reilianum]
MAASISSSSNHTHSDHILSPSTTSHTIPSSSTSAYTLSLSGTDHLRDVFHKRIRSLVLLKRALQGYTPWFQTVQLSPHELAVVFDNDRMHKRTLRYSLLGLSLSSILEIGNPSDLARAVVSLINELEGYTDDHVAALTSGTGAANFGTQRPKMRSFFKSGKQSLKRSTAAQAISEFGMLDSNMGPASTLTANSEQTSYLMAPNIPFQLDFFQTFFTLCDMLMEIYYKMLSFLPKDAATSAHGADGTAQNHGTFPRTSSPPTSTSGHTSQDQDHRTGSISQAFSIATASDTYTDSAGDKASFTSAATPVISGMTQELLLKADAKIKKVINAQVKDIDNFARQTIKDQLASLDPLMKDLGLDAAAGGSGPSAASQTSASRTTSASTSANGLPASSTSSLPFSYTAPPTSTSTPATIAPASSLPSHLRRKPDIARTSQDSAHHGHHQISLTSAAGKEGEDAAEGAGAGTRGSLIRSRSGRLRGDKDGREDASVPVYPGSAGTSPVKEA